MTGMRSPCITRQTWGRWCELLSPSVTVCQNTTHTSHWCCTYRQGENDLSWIIHSVRSCFILCPYIWFWFGDWDKQRGRRQTKWHCDWASNTASYTLLHNMPSSWLDHCSASDGEKSSVSYFGKGGDLSICSSSLWYQINWELSILLL